LKLACDAPSRQDPDVRMGLRSQMTDSTIPTAA
jgi:hypothetical protein